MVHFDASVLSGESPVYGRTGLVSFCLQGRDLATQGLFFGDSRRRTRLAKMLNSISAILSQLPCLGV